MRELRFTLKPVPPFRLDLTAWILRRRPDNDIDRWDGETYRRVWVVAGEPVEIAVTQASAPAAPRLEVSVSGAPVTHELRSSVTAALERLLGIRVDLGAFYRFAHRDARLAPLAQLFRGAKPPRFPSLFETLVNAIACQQLTLTVGITLLNRLAAGCGRGVPGRHGAVHAFPRPEDLVGADPASLRRLGFSGQKTRALLELAQAAGSQGLSERQLRALDDAAAVAHLCRIRGVGRWSAEYALLRGLGRLHVFPGDDVGARNNLRRWLGLDPSLGYDGVRRVLDAWQPYAGLVYFHLLLKSLAERGCVRP